MEIRLKREGNIEHGGVRKDQEGEERKDKGYRTNHILKYQVSLTLAILIMPQHLRGPSLLYIPSYT